MPIYEYRCRRCGTVTELLRPMSQADGEVACATCGAPAERRMSACACVTRGAQAGDGAPRTGRTGCGSCRGGNCATCR